MSVPSPLAASEGLNYSSYIRKEMLRDTRTIENGERERERESSVRYTNTPTHIHMSDTHTEFDAGFDDHLHAQRQVWFFYIWSAGLSEET